MDEQSKIADVDLSNPERRPLTPEERRRRQWKLISTLAWFVAIYASLHKFFIPFSLKFTTLKTSPYAEIDAWFLHPILLAWLISKTKANSREISFLSGVAIVYAMAEVFKVYQGNYVGWLAVSRLMSAIPLAILSGYLMTLIRFFPNYGAAWAGAAGMALLSFASSSPPNTPPSTPSHVNSPTPPTTEPVPTNFTNNLCGASKLVLNESAATSPNNHLSIAECGLSPSVLSLSNLRGSKLSVQNQLNKVVNLHLIASKNGGHRSVWNFPVPPGAKLTTPPIDLAADVVAMLYSDNSPNLGIVALQPTDVLGTWELERSPLSIRRIK